MEQIKIPDGYHSALNLHDTQIAIKTVKDFFQQTLAQKLNLLRVSAPVFVNPSSGLNDNLNGVERPVSFDIKGQPENAEMLKEIEEKIKENVDQLFKKPGKAAKGKGKAAKEEAEEEVTSVATPVETPAPAMTEEAARAAIDITVDDDD